MILQEYEKGLIWDENDHFINQSWKELKEKIIHTHGALGIVAADFEELLSYAPLGIGVEHRREWFRKLLSDATTEEDIRLMADILSIMLRKPLEANMQGGWFIYNLRKGKDLEEFDAERAALVLNELYKLNEKASKVLLWTLKNYVDFGENESNTYIHDLLIQTSLLRKELLKNMKSVKLFISYAREDNELVEEIYKKLVHRGYHVWKDNHELLPGVNWERDLKKNLKECDYVILCLSETSVSKTGYFQEEVKTIGKLQRQRPASQVFCIPIKLNEFDTTLMPPEFEELQYINMYDNWDESIDKVIKSIETNY